MLSCHALFPTVVLAQTSTQTTEEAYAIDPRDEDKNRWGAAGLSLLLPGAGQMYVNESFWPEALITLTAAAGIVSFFIVDQQRENSIRPREVNSGQTKNLADAQWEALLLILQIAIPSFWLWNAGDAFKNAEKHNKKVIRNLNSLSKAYIIEENLFSVTLWQF